MEILAGIFLLGCLSGVIPVIVLIILIQIIIVIVKTIRGVAEKPEPNEDMKKKLWKDLADRE